MKPENMLRRRVGQVVELCKKLGYPYAIGYGVTFDLDGRPLQATVHGGSSVAGAVSTVIETLSDAAQEHLNNFFDITDLPTDRQEAMGHIVFDESECRE